MKLNEYIDKNFNGSRTEFAKAQNVAKQQVTQWLKKDMIIIDKKLYSYRRDIN